MESSKEWRNVLYANHGSGRLGTLTDGEEIRGLYRFQKNTIL